MPKIASIQIKKSDAMDQFCSVRRLYETRDDENGPLQRLLAWIQREEGANFKLEDGKVKRLRFGGDSDDFLLLYYFNSKRYKIMKNGRAYISSADAENMCEGEEKSLQKAIDTILNDEIRKGLGRAVHDSGGALAKARARDAEDDVRTKMAVGIVAG